jgi:acyl-CoA synthetase (AMP-forming)/AMP-acid ligase II
MLSSAALPDFTFIGPDGTSETLALSAQTARIDAIARHFAGQLAPGAAIGLMLPSGRDLVLAWLGALRAGLQPLILQYPTGKLARSYWLASVQNTIGLTGLAAIVTTRDVAAMGLSGIVRVLPAEALAALPAGDDAPFVLDAFTILQLSSGTTGHRKAVRFTAAALARHIADYNATLGLGATDRIVSWLPLYHDMGYIACFVMPLMLGVPVVMMDPMVWVRAPSLLFRAIAEHGGTVCYMPNFGFEVMAREPAPRGLGTMRWWISCSEPVSAATARKFIDHVGAEADRFAACYAMAENVFAVAIRRGIHTAMVDGAEKVSCGAPIAGVDLRIVDDEILVRSPVSIAAYIGGEDIRDPEGFYPTGDLGRLIDGELFVSGRRQDLLIQAGRKFMLSDVDLAVNRLLPAAAGRVAALALPDERLGTEQLVILVEAQDFFLRKDGPVLADAVRAEMGIDNADVVFVPPRFLTKTSSGKINRRQTASDYHAARRHQAERRVQPADPVADMQAVFATLDWSRPCGEVLDSLSLTVLRTLLVDAGIAYDPEATLHDTAARLKSGMPPAAAEEVEPIRVVSLADAASFRGAITMRALQPLARHFGRPIEFESLCLPPSPILLSDLIFNDWFQPRLDQEPFSAIDSLLGRLRRATVIVIDDRAEIAIPARQVYGVLSHALARHKHADLLMTRWQRYAQNHDRLPVTIATGADLQARHRDDTLAMLSAYLGIPIFRIATSNALREWTAGWEYTEFGDRDELSVNGDRFVAAFKTFLSGFVSIEKRRGLVRLSARFTLPELGHYCAHMAKRETVDRIAEHFDSICIVGQRSSLPHLRRQLEKRQKRFVQIPSFAPEILATLTEPYDCMALCGAWGSHPIDTPAIAFMFSEGNGWRVRGEGMEFLDGARLNAGPGSAEDWFYSFPMARSDVQQSFIKVREEMKQAVLRKRGLRAS